MESLLTLFWVVFQATLFSTGGNGNLPALYDELVTRRGWLTGAQVAEAVGIGQIAPGPNGLWVVTLGYFVAGVPGGLVAMLAVAIPPLLVLPLVKFYETHREHPAIDGFARGLALAVTGLGLVILLRLLETGGGFTVRAVLTAVVGFGVMASRRTPVWLILALAAVAGMIG